MYLPPAHPEPVEGFPFLFGDWIKREGRASTGSARTGGGLVGVKHGLNRRECLLEISDQIIGIFNPD